MFERNFLKLGILHEKEIVKFECFRELIYNLKPRDKSN